MDVWDLFIFARIPASPENLAERGGGGGGGCGGLVLSAPFPRAP